MTVSYKKSRPSGADYYTNCSALGDGKSVDDYYTGGQKEPPGVWYVGPDGDGVRSTVLGIVDALQFGEIPGREDSDRFHSLVEGYHPENGSNLVQNAGHPERIGLHDFTMSAPKSVSVVWSQSGAELKSKIEAAQTNSARTFVDFMSRHSFTRTGKGGVNKVPGAMLGALFAHGSSREDDPQLHTHAVMFNLVEQPNGKTGALETREMMRWTGAAASLYHADLAWKMRGLGFGVQRKDKLFDINGVPDSVIDSFSRRRKQIYEAVEKRQAEMGMKADVSAASRKMVDRMTIETRSAKNELSREQLERQWLDRGIEYGFTESEIRELLRLSDPVKELTAEEIYDESIKAVDELTETAAVFNEPALLTSVATHLVGRASPEQIQSAVIELKQRYLLYTQGEAQSNDLFTTREMLALERRVVELANRPGGEHVLSGFELPGTLDAEQRDAAAKALTDRNSVTVIEGAAGAGRTFTMSSVARSFKADGYQTVGLSTSWTAALNLKESAKMDDARAITGWAKGVQDGSIELTDKHLIIVDEARMVGVRDMHKVLDLAKVRGAKVVLLGDTLQQKSVGAADALRVIVNEIGTARVDTIRRQECAEQRESVEQFFAGRAGEGLGSYINNGSVHIERSREKTTLTMVGRWAQSRKDHRTDEHLMLAFDRKSVAQLNQLAHEARKQAGEIVDGLKVQNSDCLEPDHSVEFSVGDLVQLRKNGAGQQAYNHTRGEIMGIEDRTLTIKTETGFVLLDVDDEKWQDRTTKKLALQHAYAMTVYASRDLTVDRSFVMDGTGMERSSTGVAMSRHRKSCDIFSDAQQRHEGRMRMRSADEWTPLSQYTDSDCIEDMTRSWSQEREKLSTLDFDSWKTPSGGTVQTQQQADVLERRTEMERAQFEIERIRQASKQGLPALKVLPFQERLDYLLDEPKTPQEVVRAGVDRLIEDGVHPETIQQMFDAGMLRFDTDGKSIFCGRRADGGLVNVSQDTTKPSSNDDPSKVRSLHKVASLRGRFAPQFVGSGVRVDVVRTGREALHLHSLQLRTGMPHSTIIISNGNDESLGLLHIRQQLESSAEVTRHDLIEAKEGGHPPIVQANQQIATEQALLAQEQTEQAETMRQR